MQVAESRRAAAPVPVVATRFPIMERLLEAGWLAAVLLVPLAVAHDQLMVGFIQMAKIGVFRTIVTFLLVVAALRWALEWRAAPATVAQQWAMVREHPARWIFAGTAAVLGATLVSLAFSPVKSIGVWGIDPGWDSYSLLSLGTYLVVFGVVAAHLRTPEQVHRLLWAAVAAAVVTSFYGIGQHFGFDIYRTDIGPVRRASLSFGNPIFAGSFLLMTIPLTVAVVLSLRDRLTPPQHVALGVALLTPQVTAMLFTLARGPWVGLAVAVAVLLALLLWAARPYLLRAAAMLAVAGALAMAISALPIPGSDRGGAADVVDRVGGIAPGVATGMTHRWTNWTTAAEVYATVPWVDTDLFPDVPDLGFRLLRPLVGYGPEMYGYAYPLAGETTYTHELATHGHNFIVHNALEIGLLGVAAYGLLTAAAGLLLWRLLREARSGRAPDWYLLLLIALGAVLAGRIVEQMPGKAQVSDLMFSWLLAGLLVGLATMGPRLLSGDEDGPDGPPRRAAARRRRDRTARSRGGGALAAPLELSAPRLAAAGAVALLLVVVWAIHVAAPVSGAVTTASANRASAQGELQRSINLYQDAIARYPALSMPRFQAAQLAFQVAQNADDPEVREELLWFAYEQARAVLERNPLDQRAIARAAEYHRELAAHGLAEFDSSRRETYLQVHLMPGFWQSYTSLAWSYIREEDYERGLEAIEVAKEIENGVRDAHIVFYLEAVALANLGRTEEAIDALERSLDRHPSSDAERLLAQLTGGE